MPRKARAAPTTTPSRLGLEIKRRREKLGLSQSELSRRADGDESLVKQIEKGKSQHPRADTLAALARELGCTVSELAGESQGKPRATRPGTEISPSASAIIDELDVRVSAGPGLIVESENKIGEWQLPRELIKTATASAPDRVKILSVVGDSMEPNFLPLERVMVDTADQRPTPPGVFVVWDGLGIVLKRIEFIPHSDPPRVRISSDNPKYEAYERVLGEAYIQGRVLGKWKWT